MNTRQGQKVVNKAFLYTSRHQSIPTSFGVWVQMVIAYWGLAGQAEKGRHERELVCQHVKNAQVAT